MPEEQRTITIETALRAVHERQVVLNKRDDEISGALRLVEDALRTLPLSVAVAVPLKHHGDEWVLGWAKIDGAWRLTLNGPGTNDTVSLLSAQRHLRASAVTSDSEGFSPVERFVVAIPSLLDAMVASRPTEPLRRLIKALHDAGLLP